ncbi:adenine deaminase [Candidatus Fermentibacteria bacterium]|nr:adenine deaminase [Candidatus Fermentibacteria bacterium]
MRSDSADLGRLVAAARGETVVDLLLANARVVNVLAGEIHETHVAVHDGRVVGFGDYDARKVEDLGGAYLCPGLIDAHVHLESSMVTVPEFARAVVPHGTTAIFADPHEIANVLGLDGVRFILDSSEAVPLSVFVMLPSCVPATHMETAGARLNAGDLRMILGHPRVIGLAEMMNFPGVINHTPEVMAKLAVAGDRPIDGHSPGLSGRPLAAYAAAGIGSDHESTTLEEGREKLRIGLHLMIREGSTARNLDALVPVVTPLNAARCSLCTDDTHPGDLLARGHIDHLVRRAIQSGMDPISAVQMATINTARYFGLRRLGAVAPGYWADVVVVDDMSRFSARQVYRRGVKVAHDGVYLAETAGFASNSLRSTMNVDWSATDFMIPAPDGAGDGAMARIIELVPEQIVTRAAVDRVPVHAGMAWADPSRDLLKIAVVERHLASGNVGRGFVRGFGLTSGALASSVAHDSHNIVVVGVDDADMLAAATHVARMRGGQVVVNRGEVLASVPLPIAGLMAQLPLEEVGDRVTAMTAAAHELGCRLPDPLMTMSFLALPVIPELKLTDKGLVDVGRFEIVPLFV